MGLLVGEGHWWNSSVCEVSDPLVRGARGRGWPGGSRGRVVKLELS